MAPPAAPVAAGPSLTSLNWDVLCHLVSFLPRRDLSALMRTSRELYDLCLRPLFRDPIKLRADNILSLHACLRLGTRPSRAHLLQHLIVRCSLSRAPSPSLSPSRSPSRNGSPAPPGRPIEDLLDEIFQDARGLRRLQLDWGAAISSCCLCSRATKTTLPTLEELDAPFVSEALWDAIVAVRAPLRRLAVKFGPMHRFPAADPIVLLKPFAATLESVDLAVVHCVGAEAGEGTEGAGEGTEGNTTGVVYPRVRTLALADCYYGLARGALELAPVMRAFPAVQDFALAAARVTPEAAHWRLGRATDQADLIERCRRANERRGAESEGWTELERVRAGHIVDLYMIALRCPVRRVEVEALSAGTLWMLPVALADARPEALALALFARDDALACVPGLLPPGAPGTARLRTFELSVHCDVELEISIEKITDHLVALLRPLRVEQLLLRVLRCDTVGPYRLPRDAVCAIDEALARIAVTIGEGDGDGDGQARGPGARLLGEVPSLHAVVVEVGRREVRWTRGAGTGAGARLGRPC